ncbi:(2Fe-2S)-binding protein [Kitasatospora sp. DSM 101779]|uniref:(2Fe-2S)-binding protein n=1 Tax=Kitasatospora sp. DSM 101779 TaxID=2853165 RepID=UPI0021D850FE|nr:(2Fe-2S)-binding protein [Kitasatospora sp. DSM 101779]MCU7821853.1 (2Fe-2S)-binding protein [Kitasatospora sp. DSM 101779]
MLQLTAVRASVAAGPPASIRRLVDICPALPVALLDRPPADRERWCPGDALAARAEALVAAEAARIEAAHGAAPRPHVAASRLLHHYLWSLCLLTAGPWYLDGRAARIAPSALWIEESTGDLALLADLPDDGPHGPEGLRTAVAAHAGPVLGAFQPYVRRGPHALWGMVTDDLVSALWYLGRVLGEEDRAVAAASVLLPGGTPPLSGAAAFRRLRGTEGRRHWTRTRQGCCLYYAVRPDEACTTCPRTPDEERIRRLEQ